MKIINLEQNSPEWLDYRKGKITGSKLKDIVVKRGTQKKIGFYQLIADKIAVDPSEESPMDRGHKLEDEAITKFQEKYGVEVDQVGFCQSEEIPEIGISPDGLVKHNDIYDEAVEVKCLSSAKHLKAYFEQEIPKEYIEQAMQYFIVIQKLKILHFAFYDPRVTCKDFFTIQLKREDYEEEIENLKEYQEVTLSEINKYITKISF